MDGADKPAAVSPSSLDRARRALLVVYALIALLSVDLSHGQWDLAGHNRGWAGLLHLHQAPAADLIAAALGFALMGFLTWLVTGAFDRGAWTRRDAWVLAPLVLAVVLRLDVALRSLQEIEIHLYDGVLPTLHSYFVPLLGRMLRVLPGDAHEHAFAVAGWMGALAVVPLYRFARDRTGSPEAAAVVAMAYAGHPLVVRFAPTDAPYGMMLLTLFHALACLSAPAPSVVAGAVSLALAVSCRADGALLLPVALAVVGPGALLRLWRSNRRDLAIGAAAFGTIALGSLAVVLPAHDMSQGAMTNFLTSPLRMLLTDVFTSPGLAGQGASELAANRVWQGLVGLGLIAGLLDRRLRWAWPAGLGAVLVASPYPAVTWVWPVAAHRLVPMDALLAMVAGAGVAWPVLWLRGASARAGLTAAAVVGLVGLSVASVDLLTRPWFFNVEWEMVRAGLAPGGVESPECPVLEFAARSWDDMDVHDVGQMLFDTAVTTCWENDCVALAQMGTCHRYVRGLHCYLNQAGVEGVCADPGLTPDDAVARCLAPECAAVEAALQLTPIEERTIRPPDTFGGTESVKIYPPVVKVGVYQIDGVKLP